MLDQDHSSEPETTHAVEFQDVAVSFHTDDGDRHIVRDINLAVRPGEILGVVGESGSGKSLTSLTVIGMLPPGGYHQGTVLVNGEPVGLARDQLTGNVPKNFTAMIFQNPMVSFNPYFTIGKQMSDVITRHFGGTVSAAYDVALSYLKQVLMPEPEASLYKYPHEFSGGQLQRIMIAMALATKPAVLIGDEPTTALDVTVQKEIVELLGQVARDNGIAVIFVSHDLNVVGNLCDRIAVMRKGVIVEEGRTEQIMVHPAHEYTQKLLAATPKFEEAERIEAEGNSTPLIDVRKVSKIYHVAGKEIYANRDISFAIKPGECLGIVGESGSGKSTVSNIILGLTQASSGEIFYKGQDLATASRAQVNAFQSKLGVVFQNPYSSLNPRMSIERIIAEPLVIQGQLSAAQIREKVLWAAQKVEIDPAVLVRTPGAFSGGQRQRFAIARAIISEPEFLILDEPTSALDVSVQAQVLALLKDLQTRLALTFLFISHDLAVVRQLCDRVLVMRRGEVVEQGQSEEIFLNPQTEYTAQLIAAIPQYQPGTESPTQP